METEAFESIREGGIDQIRSSGHSRICDECTSLSKRVLPKVDIKGCKVLVGFEWQGSGNSLAKLGQANKNQ
ncbi:hypothetical protein PIB30_072402, partial [Stylosanthes scabra]|nr:hypothetical protein [Stylosanthes scabra]